MNEKTVDTWFDSEPPKANVLHFNINPKNVLNKRYSGKSDRVALFKMYQDEWNKNLYIH